MVWWLLEGDWNRGLGASTVDGAASRGKWSRIPTIYTTTQISFYHYVYSLSDLDVLTEKINFQKDMGADMIHLLYSRLCFCGSFNWFRSKN